MKRRFLAAVCTLGLAVSMLAGCGGTGETPKEEKKEETADNKAGKSEEGVFVQAISAMPVSLQPSTASDDQTTICRPIFDVLFGDSSEGFEYYLADKVEVSEDGLTYKIHINDKANWSDGEPVTVQDILFTMEYSGLNYGGVSSYNTINGNPIQFNSVDDKTLECVLPEPYNTYMQTLSRSPILPSHAFDNDPTKVDNSGYFNSTDMATSGAYTVAEINEDSIVYVARDDYYRGTPQVKKVIMKTIGSGSTRQVAFESGEISYMRVTTNEELSKYSNSDEYNVYEIPEARLNYLQINPFGDNSKDLSDDARKAIFLALNPGEILDVAYGNEALGQSANSLITPQQGLYDPAWTGYKQNLDEAKKLAESSGLKGKTLTYIFNSDRPNMEAIATVVQQQLAEIGVTVNVEAVDSASFFPRFFAKMFKSGQEATWDLGTNGWDSERGNHLAQCYSYTSRNAEAWGFSQDVVDLAKKINATTDKKEVSALAAEFQQKTLDECRIYPLTYTNYVMVSHKDVTGLDGSKIIPEFVDYLSIKVE